MGSILRILVEDQHSGRLHLITHVTFPVRIAEGLTGLRPLMSIKVTNATRVLIVQRGE
jgi:hypothetical protein